MVRYCAQCGGVLGEREVGGRLRPACAGCGAVVFEDPKLAVAVLIEREGGVLMGRRSRSSASPGKWSFPAGYVDRGEQVEDAAIREVREETGLDIRLDALLGLYSATGEATVLAVYVGTVIGGAIRAADDLTELAVFPFDAPPAPAFAHDPQILADWLAWRAARAGAGASRGCGAAQPQRAGGVRALHAGSNNEWVSETNDGRDNGVAPTTTARGASMTASTAIPTRADVPVEETWDLTKLYAGEADWEADATRVRALRDEIVAGRGGAGESIQALANVLDAQAAMDERISRLYIYAMLARDENTADPAALGRFERIATIATEIGASVAFLTPEILDIPQETLRAWMADPILKDHRQGLDDLDRNRPHVRSAEVEELLAATGEIARAPGSAFTALDNADLSFGTGRDEDGREIELTKGRVSRILQKRNRPARREAQEKMAAAYSAHRNTLAALHGASIRKDVFYARARGYPSALGAALFGDNIPTSVYDSLIDAVHAALPAFGDYLELRRRVLGVDKLAPYDLLVPMAELDEGEMTYGEATRIGLEGLAPLGERYLGDLRRGLQGGRWVDVHETANKRSGGYNIGPYGAQPYILMNWSGTRQDLYTLIHEAGHAMHGFYSNAAQPYSTASYTIFCAEVASTVNETLLTWHLLDHARSDAERFAVLGQFLDDVRSTLITQTMYAEFERWTHAQVEAGAALTAEGLSDEWGRLFALYHPSVELTDAARIGWARIPHFYRGFYVFQYATGLSAAIALAAQIRAEGQPAVDRYLHFLASGGSDYSIELLRRAGVDMTTPQPVGAALAEFAARTAEATTLFERGAVQSHNGE